MTSERFVQLRHHSTRIAATVYNTYGTGPNIQKRKKWCATKGYTSEIFYFVT